MFLFLGVNLFLFSWWPLPSQWNKASNGYNAGFWTDWNEVWYQKHLASILNGTAKPKSPNNWRDDLKGSSSWRKTTKVLIERSKELYA